MKNRLLFTSRVLLFGVLLALFSLVSVAEERKVICAEYVPSGSKYKVQATFITGSELNSATRSWDYDSLSKYVVIFWKQNQATIIDVGSFWPSIIATSGTDQQGREWSVSTSTTLCY